METALQEKDRKNRARIRELVEDMPDYFDKYVKHALATGTRTSTVLVYTYDMRIFLAWAAARKEGYRDIRAKDMPLQLFRDITQHDLDDYQIYLRSYPDPSGQMKPMKDRDGNVVLWKKGEAGPEGEPRMVPVMYTNGDAGVRRKTMSLSTFYNYLILNDLAVKNPLFKRKVVTVPRKAEKVRLRNNEPEKLLRGISAGKGVHTVRQRRYYEMLFRRDYAIVVALLDTGLRVSELVGLDMDDINFQENYFIVTRKGGRQDKVFYSEEVQQALLEYIEGESIPIEVSERYSTAQLNNYMDFLKKHLLAESLEPLLKETFEACDESFLADMEALARYLRASGRSAFRPDNTNAVFLSLRGKRISVRTVEMMLKKYIRSCLIVEHDGHYALDPGTVARLRKVGPHKLRTTYASQLAEAGVSPEILKELMGHSSFVTTADWYTDVTDKRKRAVAARVRATGLTDDDE